MTEAEGRAVLKRRFDAAGLAIVDDVRLTGEGYDVVADGWDAARKVGYEFLTVEAGDEREFDATALAALDALNHSGALSILLVDEHDVDDAAELELAADRFLGELRTRAAVNETLGTNEFLQLARARFAEINQELQAAQALAARHAAERQQRLAERAQLDQQLTVAVLPELTPAAVARAVRISGFMTLAQQDPFAAVAAERADRDARVAAIEADPRWIDRERLRAPRTGTLSRQIDELEDFRAPLVDVVKRADHKRLGRLLDSGYGTDEYHVHFWRMSYYLDWSAGDAILEKFPEKKTFAEVREELRSANVALGLYDVKLRELRAEFDAGEALVKEHGEQHDALASLEARHLAAWRQLLERHLASLEPAMIADRLVAEPDVELLFKQRAGVAQKISYLDDLVNTQVGQYTSGLRAEQQQLAREIAKYQRPKNYNARFDAAKLDRRFSERPAKLRKAWDRTTGAYNTIDAFDRYENARFVENFLWWDLMTSGRYDGRWIPEVGSFYESRPDYHYDHHQWDVDTSSHFDDAAAAVATADFSSAHDVGGALDPS